MKRPYSEESGFILVLAIFVIMGLLAVMMLAIDLGNVYIWRVRLERAAKAGTSAGLGHRTLKGWQYIYGSAPNYDSLGNLILPASSATPLAELINQMRKAFDTTIKSSKTPQGAVTTVTASTYNLRLDRAELSVRMTLPTLLLGRLKVFGISIPCNNPDNPALCDITTTQSASLSPSNIVLLLDTSGSMECEAPTGSPGSLNCACRTSTTSPCGSGTNPRLISLLKTAVHTFHGFFNPVRDRIAIVPFNLGANRSFSFMDNAGAPRSFGKNEATYQAFTNTIGDPSSNNGLIPFGNTNPCDAFILAGDEIKALKAHPSVDGSSLRPQVVFFTDGAPNAMRGIFTNQHNNRLTAAKPSSSASDDWYQYSIEWDDGSLYRAPSPLIHSSFPLFNKRIDSDGLPVASAPPPPASTPPAPTPTPAPTPARCGDPWYEKPSLRFLGSLNAAEPTPAPSRKQGCLTGLDFDLPGTAATPGVNNYGVRGVAFDNRPARTVPYTDQLPYYCTIEAADYIRQELNGTVFAVGLGPTADTCYNVDPLQDSDNAFIRKDNFLARVAFDPIKTVTTTSSGCDFAPQTKFHGTRSVMVPAGCLHRLQGQTFQVGYNPPSASGTARLPGDFAPGTQGEYIGFADPFRIRLAFAQIAKQILFRLNK